MTQLDDEIKELNRKIQQANNDHAKCKGESPDGNHVCAYREVCARYVRPDGDRQVYADFWKAEEECPHYESVIK